MELRRFVPLARRAAGCALVLLAVTTQRTEAQNQALSAEYVAAHHAELEPKVYVVPEAIDAEVARLKLAALGIELEPMTSEQAAYVASWQHGT